MKVFLLLCTLAFSLNATCACFRAAPPAYAIPGAPPALPASSTFVATHLSSGKPTVGSRPSKHTLYRRGKGTMGFIAGLILGPIGLFGVAAVSHNQTAREKALKGFTWWALIGLVGVLVWAAAASKESFGQIMEDMGAYIFEGLIEGILDGIGSN